MSVEREVIQLSMSFAPGLTREFKTLRQVTQSAVLRTRGGVSAVAAAVDKQPSLLGRKLQGSPDDPHRTLDIDDWEDVLAELVEQGDFSPIFYLLEKFKLSAEQRQSAAVTQLAALLPQVAQLVADAQAAKPTDRRRR
jgi:hypothetical protein